MFFPVVTWSSQSPNEGILFHQIDVPYFIELFPYYWAFILFLHFSIKADAIVAIFIHVTGYFI